MAGKQIRILAGIIFLILIGLYALWNQDQYTWDENYDSGTNDPYGTQVLRTLLEAYFPEEPLHILEENLDALGTERDTANYVFIGNGMYPDSTEMKLLLDFAARGNRVFISSKVAPVALIETAIDSFCSEYSWWEAYDYYHDTLATLNFLHPKLAQSTPFSYQFIKRDSSIRYYGWDFISDYYFCSDTISPAALGTVRDSFINFAKFDYGAGALYLHTTPIAFTNIQLLRRQSLEYAELVFSHLAEGPIYWDIYSGLSEQLAQELNNSNLPPSNRGLSDESPLQYVLSQPSLAWAWYLSLLLGLLYLIFRAKRRQRIIPVLEKNENTSLAFVQNIGRLYYNQQNHRQLALQKMRLFLADMRERYHLNTSQLDAPFKEKLHSRTAVPMEQIEKLLLLHRNIESSSFTSENILIELHRLIALFREER